MEKKLDEFLKELELRELSKRTLKKYKSDIMQMIKYLKIEKVKDITKEKVIEYKDYLIKTCQSASVNNKTTIINQFVTWLIGNETLKTKMVKIQKKNTTDKIISVSDYDRLIRMAEKLEKKNIMYLMKTLRGTGIRIDELKYITVEAVKKGSAKVFNKNKERDIILSKGLSKELKVYCKEQGITSGIIFRSKFGNILDKSYIWKEMKNIAGQARVSKIKVHAHSFRHLFAKDFLKESNNVLALADILGHSNLETTRIYTKGSIEEQREILDRINKK